MSKLMINRTFIYKLNLKSNDDKEIIIFYLQLSLFYNELIKANITLKFIDTYAKDSNIIIASNKIQKEQIEQHLINNKLKI